MEVYNINLGLRIAQDYNNIDGKEEFEKALDICQDRINTEKILKMNLSREFRDLARLAA